MTGRLRIEGLRRRFPDGGGLAGIDLDIAAGSLVCVVGPSGGGKTTLLRCIAGMERPDAGRIVLDGAELPPVHAPGRPTAMVFQADTLFPDLDVAANIGFGLRVRRQPASAVAEAVDVALLRLGLTGLEHRFPDELSGGQQRRVALARALVLQPSVLLLDEPLAGLDPVLSRQTMHQIRATQRRLGLTTVLVTHDREAALSAADQLVVLDAGRVVQSGAPRTVFERPDSTFVAQYVGRASFLETEVVEASGGTARVSAFGMLLSLPAHPDVRAGQPAAVLVRPHALSVTAASQSSTPWAEVAGDLGVVEDVHYTGERLEYVVETEHGSLIGTGRLADPVREVGDTVRLALDVAQAWVLLR